jgi:hypothetical protein
LFLNISLCWRPFRFKVCVHRDKQAKFFRTKWKFEGEEAKVLKERTIKEGTWKEEDDANDVGEDDNLHLKGGLRGVWSN